MLIVAEIIGEDWLPLRCALGMPAEHENPRKRHKRIQRVLLRGGIRLRSRKALAHAAESLLTCGEVDEETIEAALVLLPSSDRLHALTTRARKRARTPAHQRMHVASLLAGMQSAYLISNGVLSAQAALRSPGYMQRNARMIPRTPLLAHLLWCKSLRRPRFISNGKRVIGRPWFHGAQYPLLSESPPEAEHIWSLARSLRNLRGRGSSRLLQHFRKELSLSYNGTCSVESDPVVACAHAQTQIAVAHPQGAEDTIEALCANLQHAPPHTGDARAQALLLAFRRARRQDASRICDAAVSLLRADPTSVTAIRILLQAFERDNDESGSIGPYELIEPLCSHLDAYRDSEPGWIGLLNVLMLCYRKNFATLSPINIPSDADICALRDALRARSSWWSRVHFEPLGTNQALADVRNLEQDEERFMMVCARAVCARAMLGQERSAMVRQYQHALSALQPSSMASSLLNSDPGTQEQRNKGLCFIQACKDLRDDPAPVEKYDEESLRRLKQRESMMAGSLRKRGETLGKDISYGCAYVRRNVQEHVLQHFKAALCSAPSGALCFSTDKAARLAVLQLLRGPCDTCDGTNETSNKAVRTRELGRATLGVMHASVQTQNVYAHVGAPQLAVYVQELLPEHDLSGLKRLMEQAAVEAARSGVTTGKIVGRRGPSNHSESSPRIASIEREQAIQQTRRQLRGDHQAPRFPANFWQAFPHFRRQQLQRSRFGEGERE